MKLEPPAEFGQIILVWLQWLADQLADSTDWNAGGPDDKRAFEWLRAWVKRQRDG